MSEVKRYDVRDTIAKVPEATIYYIIGQGGVGKSYSVKKHLVLNYLDTGMRFIFLKRYETDTRARLLNSVFSDTSEDPEIKERLEERYNPEGNYSTVTILPSGSDFAVKGIDNDGKLTVLDRIGRIAALSKAYAFKGGVYNDYNRIFFDEFVSTMGYIEGDKEPDYLTAIIGTVSRSYNPVKVFMCANADAPIEMCPHMYGLKIDYEHIQANCVYKFDTVTPEGKVLPNNTVFIKLANYGGQTFINERAGNIFGSGAEAVRMDGSVQTSKFIHIDDPERIKALYLLEVETAVITETEWHRRIYALVGYYGKEPCIYLSKHKPDFNGPTLYCRYDKERYVIRREWQTYRLNIPPHERFSKLQALINYATTTRLIIADEDMTGTIFEAIRKAS